MIPYEDIKQGMYIQIVKNEGDYDYSENEMNKPLRVALSVSDMNNYLSEGRGYVTHNDSPNDGYLVCVEPEHYESVKDSDVYTKYFTVFEGRVGCCLSDIESITDNKILKNTLERVED